MTPPADPTIAQSDRGLWEYAVWLYGQDGVKQACLALQDEHDVDVVALLATVWAATAVAVDDTSVVVGAAGVTAMWSRRVVRPLRAARRALTTEGIGVDPEAASSLGARAAEVELDAEREQLRAIERRVRDRFSPVDPGSAAERAERCAMHLAALMPGVIRHPEAAARVRTMVAAAIPGVDPALLDARFGPVPAVGSGRRESDADSPRTLTVSMLQVESSSDEPRAERIDRVAGLVEQEIDESAPDAIVLPELWTTGFFHADRYADEAEPVDGPTVQRLTALAGAGGIWLFGGSFVEIAADGSLHNTSICCSPAGRLAGVYRKIHLFGYESDEARVLTSGREISVVDTPFGRVAMTTCYDLRFPELYRRLLDAGAEIVVVCSAWPEARREHWELFNRARAAENLSAVIACNATGEQRGVALAGTSLVVSPWGEIIARAGTEPDWVRAELDLTEIATRRQGFPALDDRRL